MISEECDVHIMVSIDVDENADSADMGMDKQTKVLDTDKHVIPPEITKLLAPDSFTASFSAERPFTLLRVVKQTIISCE